MNTDGTLSTTEHNARVVGYVDPLGYLHCLSCATEGEPVRWDSGDGGLCDACCGPIEVRGAGSPPL